MAIVDPVTTQRRMAFLREDLDAGTPAHKVDGIELCSTVCLGSERSLLHKGFSNRCLAPNGDRGLCAGILPRAQPECSVCRLRSTTAKDSTGIRADLEGLVLALELLYLRLQVRDQLQALVT